MAYKKRNRLTTECRMLRQETEVRKVLAMLKQFETQEGHLIDELYGEIWALEYVLEERNDLV